MQVRLRRLPILFTVILLLGHLFLVPLSIVYAQTENEILEQSSTEEDSDGKKYLDNSKVLESKEPDHIENQENDELFHKEATELIESPDSQVEVEDQLTEEINNNNQELSDQDIPTSEEIRFSIDVGDYLEVQKNEKFSIEVSTNQAIDSLRIVVPKGTDFSFIDEKSRTHLQTYDNGSSLWLIKFNQKNNHFPATFSVLESGQISVEDSVGEVHSAFLYINTGVVAKNSIGLNETNARTSIVVNTWANFRTAWNNNARTLIYITGDMPQGTTSLNTRTSSVRIEGGGSSSRLSSGTRQTLSWTDSVSVTIGNMAVIQNFGMTGGTLNITGVGIVETNNPISVTEANVNSVGGSGGASSQGAPLYSSSTLNIGTLNHTTGRIVTTNQTITIGTLNLLSNNYSIRNSSGNRVVNANEVNISSGLMSWDLRNTTTMADRGWESLQAVIRNNTITSSSDSSFNDQSFQLANSSWIRGWGSAGDAVTPPSPTPQVYSLSLQASPSEGGRPTASTTTLAQGGTTTITANPNSDYRFVRWEIISGTGASITNTTSASTTFTMGSSNASIRAVYEVSGTDPVDPPEPEINPEGFNLIASPSYGGSPAYSKFTNTGWDIYMLTANPNTGFRFVRWEIASGTGDLYFEDNPNSGQYVTPSGSSATIRAVYERISYDLTLEASPSTGGTPEAESYSIGQGESTTITANPSEGYDFIRWEITSGSGSRIEEPTDESTVFTMGNSNVTVQAIYEESQADRPIAPVDPLDPEVEVNPENKPELPEDQGLLSIDFVSSFKFGSQFISVHDQTYYAQPQRLLNEDGTVIESEERPNYVQISDRRSESERNGWQLAVTQKEQFKNQTNQELTGARLNLLNQQLLTAQGGEEPSLQATNPLALVPGNKRTLIRAEGTEGTGTWVYRFGDGETAEESVSLDVPKGANPEATNYSTTLTWELSAVPGN